MLFSPNLLAWAMTTLVSSQTARVVSLQLASIMASSQEQDFGASNLARSSQISSPLQDITNLAWSANHTISHCNAKGQRKCPGIRCMENCGAPVFFISKPQSGWANQTWAEPHSVYTDTPHSTHNISNHATYRLLDGTILKEEELIVGWILFSFIHCRLRVISMWK